MYKSWNGVACIADMEIPDRHAIIPLSTLSRLCADFLYKPLYCNKLEAHGDWSYQYIVGVITSAKMVGPEMHLGGKLFRPIPHCDERLGMSIDTLLSDMSMAHRQWFGLRLGIPWKMDDFKPKGVTVIKANLAAINTTTFNINY
jgi:hypothetical protein